MQKLPIDSADFMISFVLSWPQNRHFKLKWTIPYVSLFLSKIFKPTQIFMIQKLLQKKANTGIVNQTCRFQCFDKQFFFSNIKMAVTFFWFIFQVRFRSKV